MINEAYCSYEVSKLLKEKGFDESCRSYFIDNVDYIDSSYSTEELTDLQMGIWEILRPTHQMAMAWLREKHNIFILVGWNSIHEEYFTRILNMTDGIPKRNIHEHASYEEAIEEALKYCLENLL